MKAKAVNAVLVMMYGVRTSVGICFECQPEYYSTIIYFKILHDYSGLLSSSKLPFTVWKIPLTFYSVEFFSLGTTTRVKIFAIYPFGGGFGMTSSAPAAIKVSVAVSVKSAV